MTGEERVKREEQFKLLRAKNKKSGYHVTVYSCREAQGLSDVLKKIVPIYRCRYTEGDPLARVFKGAHVDCCITHWSKLGPEGMQTALFDK